MPVPRDASLPSRSVDRYFDSAGVPIRYIDCGAGEPVVLVHSYSGDLDDQWITTGVLDALEPDFIPAMLTFLEKHARPKG